MASESFSLEVVASTYTGYLLCDSFRDVHHMMEHVLASPLWTHQIPIEFDSCKAEIRRQFPGLADVIDRRIPVLLKAFEEADNKGEPRVSWIQPWIQTLVMVDGVASDYEVAGIAKDDEY